MDRPERKVLWLPAAEIRPNPMQPRRTFEETGLRELAESIRRHGILQPLTVRRTAAGWELVAGERRLRAAVLAGLETVPCLEAEVDGRASALLALVENLQRRDLHYLEEAEAIAAFLHQTGMTQEAVAAQLGMSPSALANKLRLLRLSPACRALLVEHGSDGASRPLPAAAGGRGRAADRPAPGGGKALECGPDGAVCRAAAGSPPDRAARRTADVHHQGRAIVFEQCGPGAAADSGRRCGRPDGAGGDRGRNRSDAPHSETASERGLKLLIVTGL